LEITFSSLHSLISPDILPARAQAFCRKQQSISGFL